MADTQTTTGAETGGRRLELLEIAVRLFAEHGVAKTTVRDIADAAGMLSGSLYYHFASKDQIVAEALGGGLETRIEATRSVIESSPDQAAALVRLLIGAVRWVGAEPDIATILNNDKSYIRDNPDLLETETNRQLNRVDWVELIEDGVAAGVFRPVANADVIVRSMLDGVLGATRWMYGAEEPDSIAKELAAFYLNGLLAEGYRYDFEARELIAP